MPYIKLTNPRFANLTGQLPGKNFRGVSFVNGVSATDLPLAVADKIAAQLSGTMLCNAAGVVSGPAGSLNRLPTSIIPERAWPRSESVIGEGSDSARVRTIDDTAYTITEADFGMILNFTEGATVTVSSNLPAAFQCALRQGGEDQIKIVATGEAVVEEIDGRLMSEKRLAILTLIRFPDGKFQLVGRTA